jgi:hypothetical protein
MPVQPLKEVVGWSLQHVTQHADCFPNGALCEAEGSAVPRNYASPRQRRRPHASGAAAVSSRPSATTLQAAQHAAQHAAFVADDADAGRGRPRPRQEVGLSRRVLEEDRHAACECAELCAYERVCGAKGAAVGIGRLPLYHVLRRGAGPRRGRRRLCCR